MYTSAASDMFTWNIDVLWEIPFHKFGTTCLQQKLSAESTITNELSHLHLEPLLLKLSSLVLCIWASRCWENEPFAIHLLQYSQYVFSLCGRWSPFPFGGGTNGLATMPLIGDCCSGRNNLGEWLSFASPPSRLAGFFLGLGLTWATPGVQGGPINWRWRIWLSSTRHWISWEHLSTRSSMNSNRPVSTKPVSGWIEYNSVFNPCNEVIDHRKANTWQRKKWNGPLVYTTASAVTLPRFLMQLMQESE